MFISNEKIRAKTRQALGGGVFTSEWCSCGLAVVIHAILLSVCTSVAVSISQASILGIIGSVLTESTLLAVITVVLMVLPPIVSTVIAHTLTVGLHAAFIPVGKYGDTIDTNALFGKFKAWWSCTKLGVMRDLLTWLWSLLFIIPGIIKHYSYSMAFYIMADHPEYTWQQCLAESERLMKGHKMQYFCLQCSFLGWYALGMLTWGISNFWVVPYQHAANAVFYSQLLDRTTAV